MYLLKEIIINQSDKTVKVENGIKFEKIDGVNTIADSWWGKGTLTISEYAEVEKEDERFNRVAFCNDYKVKNLSDGLKNIDFNVVMKYPEIIGIDGVMVFVKNAESIKTDGIILFGRYPTEGIFVLKEGQYINLGEHQFKVSNKALWCKF